MRYVMNLSSIILEAQNIKKDYILPNERIEVLKDINLKVKKGEMITIVGPSGSGKSTLLNILGTLDYPTQGSIIFNSTDLSKLTDNQLAEIRNKYIGFVFQFHHLLPEFNLLENVAFPLLVADGNKREIWGKANQLIERMGLKNRIRHRPDCLSGGEKQRVAVARALINKPHLILADEPTGNLDAKNGDMLIETFIRLRDEDGLTIVLVTHNHAIASHADRAFNLKEGRLYAL